MTTPWFSKHEAERYAALLGVDLSHCHSTAARRAARIRELLKDPEPTL
jgi:hypothetical protein